MTVLSAQLRDITEDVASSLATISMENSGALITTPLLYPSGSHVVVHVSGSGNTFFVSDQGFASMEAEMMGGDLILGRLAQALTKTTGALYDQHCFYLANVKHSGLVTAVTIVANASKEAVDQTAYKVAERKNREEEEVLVARLNSIFGSKFVLPKYKLVGASNHEWDFNAAVVRDDHRSIFELVSPAAVSIYSTVTRFTDIADLKEHPDLVAVLSDRLKTNSSNINLLCRSANVIDLKADDETYRQAA